MKPSLSGLTLLLSSAFASTPLSIHELTVRVSYLISSCSSSSPLRTTGIHQHGQARVADRSGRTALGAPPLRRGEELLTHSAGEEEREKEGGRGN